MRAGPTCLLPASAMPSMVSPWGAPTLGSRVVGLDDRRIDGGKHNKFVHDSGLAVGLAHASTARIAS